ncbi:MAG: hypothetical protein AAGM22_23430 [Acidobacteriota bacterium]
MSCRHSAFSSLRLRRHVAPVVAMLFWLPPGAAQSSGSAGPGPRVEARTLYVAATGQSPRHLVFTPTAYSADEDRRWPLIVGLHGTAGNPEQIMGFQRLLELAERYGYLVVSPHSSGVGELHRRYVRRVIADTEEHYRVDPGRVFLLGISRGGRGLWDLAIEDPDRWAGLAPISPVTPSDPKPLERLRHLPMIVVLGDRDKAISQSAVRRWVKRMADLDMRHRFVELPGLGHDLSRVNFLPLVFDFFERSAQLSSERKGRGAH